MESLRIKMNTITISYCCQKYNFNQKFLLKILILTICLSILIIVSTSNKALATVIFKDNFQDTSVWEFISDNVMGGVSTGGVIFKPENQTHTALLSGYVSTDNKGGFIQIRRHIRKVDLNEANFIGIVAKGNNQKYYIHLRTSGMIFPWQYYQTHFVVGEKFENFEIPISKFKRSGFLLPEKIKPENITTFAIVAFGRNHDAELYVREISFLSL